jgi:hypothetical protein
MRLYLDTEFTDLVPHAKLISIALVDSNGESFYAELTDTYSLKECSAFVKEHVLPFLRGGSYQMTSIECSLKMGNWIEDREEECVLACDNPSWDVPYLNRLLADCWPINLRTDLIVPVFFPEYIKEDLVLEHNFDIHNALDDAKVMYLGMKQLNR